MSEEQSRSINTSGGSYREIKVEEHGTYVEGDLININIALQQIAESKRSRFEKFLII